MEGTPGRLCRNGRPRGRSFRWLNGVCKRVAPPLILKTTLSLGSFALQPARATHTRLDGS